MGCAVIVTPQAIEDLGVVVRRIAADSPIRARQFGHLLLDKALAVGPFPEMGRAVPEANDPAVREVILEPYRIIYEVYPERGAAYVLRFWHGARGKPEFTKVGSA